MTRIPRRTWTTAALAGLALCVTGCVERSMKISSDPEGARVFVNDEEVGLTPVKLSFLWYGDYDIVLRKEGYETLKTNHRVRAPWYQWPPFDLIAETLVPGTIRDEHELPLYELTPLERPDVSGVVQRAEELRDQTVFQQ